MAETYSFPMLPVNHWWALRSKFKTAIPKQVTVAYLASALNIKESSARSNVLAPLKLIGIVNEDGTPQDLSKAWRDDQQYPAVCKELLDKLYPDELLSVASDPVADRDVASRWFSNHTGHGSGAVRRMLSFYTLLLTADPSQGGAAKQNASATPAGTAAPKTRQKNGKGRRVESASAQGTPVAASTVKTPSDGDSITENASKVPSVNINLQIHIPSDATTAQIDSIFESMAKHLYSKK